MGPELRVAVGSGRTDYHTAVGMLEKLARSFPWRYRTYCEAHGIEALIKPQHWEQAKGRAFRSDPSRVENMAIQAEGSFAEAKQNLDLRRFPPEGWNGC
ncbi:MAG: hypothetical protein SPF89_09495 [Sphaerochaetaceae bacterium]|nr:hypothetical protein [Spirochaetales bacterium]MDY5500325.1 hypothetical protein [Sphaerochaetaceae bacterium]